MAIERTFYCDAPECETHVRSASTRPFGMIFLTDTSGLTARRTMHFCSFDCVLRFAAGQPPVEVRSWEEPPWGDAHDAAA